MALKVKSREVLAKAPTGIAGLDEINGYVWSRGRAALIRGGSGSGKTILALQSLLNGAVLFNVLPHAERALAEDARLTPTLIRFFSQPVRRIIGTRADTRPLLQTFGLPVPVP